MAHIALRQPEAALIVARYRSRHLERMDRPARPHAGQEPPSGEYVVFHERPYPKRLDRAFRVGAIVVAAPILAAGLALAGYGFFAAADIRGIGAMAMLGIIFATLAYGLTRAIGLVVTSIVGGLRRKAYVVDWEETPPNC